MSAVGSVTWPWQRSQTPRSGATTRCRTCGAALLEGGSVTRAEAADTLWRLGDRKAIPALREALTREGWHQTLTRDGWQDTASPAIVETR